MNNRELAINVFKHPLIQEILKRKLAESSIINRLIVEEILDDEGPEVEQAAKDIQRQIIQKFKDTGNTDFLFTDMYDNISDKILGYALVNIPWAEPAKDLIEKIFAARKKRKVNPKGGFTQFQPFGSPEEAAQKDADEMKWLKRACEDGRQDACDRWKELKKAQQDPKIQQYLADNPPQSNTQKIEVLKQLGYKFIKKSTKRDDEKRAKEKDLGKLITDHVTAMTHPPKEEEFAALEAAIRKEFGGSEKSKRRAPEAELEDAPEAELEDAPEAELEDAPEAELEDAPEELDAFMSLLDDTERPVFEKVIEELKNQNILTEAVFDDETLFPSELKKAIIKIANDAGDPDKSIIMNVLSDDTKARAFYDTYVKITPEEEAPGDEEEDPAEEGEEVLKKELKDKYDKASKDFIQYFLTEPFLTDQQRHLVNLLAALDFTEGEEVSYRPTGGVIPEGRVEDIEKWASTKWEKARPTLKKYLDRDTDPEEVDVEEEEEETIEPKKEKTVKQRLSKLRSDLRYIDHSTRIVQSDLKQFLEIHSTQKSMSKRSKQSLVENIIKLQKVIARTYQDISDLSGLLTEADEETREEIVDKVEQTYYDVRDKLRELDTEIETADSLGQLIDKANEISERLREINPYFPKTASFSPNVRRGSQEALIELTKDLELFQKTYLGELYKLSKVENIDSDHLEIAQNGLRFLAGRIQELLGVDSKIPDTTIPPDTSSFSTTTTTTDSEPSDPYAALRAAYGDHDFFKHLEDDWEEADVNLAYKFLSYLPLDRLRSPPMEEGDAATLAAELSLDEAEINAALAKLSDDERNRVIDLLEYTDTFDLFVQMLQVVDPPPDTPHRAESFKDLLDNPPDSWKPKEGLEEQLVYRLQPIIERMMQEH